MYSSEDAKLDELIGEDTAVQLALERTERGLFDRLDAPEEALEALSGA